MTGTPPRGPCPARRIVHGHLPPEPGAQRPAFRGIDRDVPFGRNRSARQEDLHPLGVIRLDGLDRQGFRLQPCVHRRRVERERTARGDCPLPVEKGCEGESTALLGTDGDVFRLQPEPVEVDFHRRIRGAILEHHGVSVYDRFLDGDPPRLVRRPLPPRIRPDSLRADRFRGSPVIRHKPGDVRFPARGTPHGDHPLSTWRSPRS